MEEVKMRALIIVLLASCTNYDWAWERGTGLRPETRGEIIITSPNEPVLTWQRIVDIAIISWSDVLGDDCPFPYPIVEAGGKPLTLVDPTEWDHGKYGGWATEDSLEILAGREDTKILTTTIHEIGHAFGLDHEPEGSGSVMAKRAESVLATAEDGIRARIVLGCD
jgi:hypothetical protein